MSMTSDMSVPRSLSEAGALSVASAVTVRSEAARELGQSVHELIGHQIDLDEFTLRFLASRIYMLCPVRPGLFVMSRPGAAAIVPVWCTVRALRKVMGSYDYLARTGEDLVDHLPDGVVVLVDAGMRFPITLPSSLLLGHR